MGMTEQLAEFVATTPEEAIPEPARMQARRAVTDTLGVMLIGSREDCSRIAAEMVRAEESRPAATVVGHSFRTSVRGAALVNGVSAHALDYDDVNSAMTGHPSAPLLPTVLAVAEGTQASGRDLVTAFVLGFEIEVRLGRGLGRSHYARGWHATATLGTLAAAAAAARLYHLDVPATRMALGIAASMASGSRQNFGTMTKPLHPGHAAQNGIAAAVLARGGFTSDPGMLEAPLGFLNLFSPADDAHPDAVTTGLGRRFEILESGISVKQYPCCFGTHRALDATLALNAETRISAADVERIDVLIPRGAAEPLIHPRPTLGLEGKFSMQYCVAAALLDGQVKLDSFEDDAVRRPPVQDLLRRVEMHEDSTESTAVDGFADVTIVMRDGRRLQRRVDEPRGSAILPLSLEELEGKYRECAERVLGPGETEQTLDMIQRIETLPSVSTLLAILSAGAATPV
jgi:2-methylcitrate dehydratase PrpD